MSAKWVNAARSPYIPGTRIHFSTLTPLAFMVVYFAWVTFIILLGAVSFMAVLSIKGRTLTWLLRRTKSRIRGGRVLARPVWFRRRFSRLESFDLHGISESGASAGRVAPASSAATQQPRARKPAAS